MKFKNIDEYEEPEELSVEEMQQFDGDITEPDELLTISKITEGVEIEENSNDMISESDINSYFDKEALNDLFNVFGEKVDLI